MKGSSCEDLIFVVIGDGNQQLGVSVVHGGSKIVSVSQCELIGIASSGSIYSVHFVSILFNNDIYDRKGTYNAGEKIPLGTLPRILGTPAGSRSGWH
jgi:hypothetical protein